MGGHPVLRQIGVVAAVLAALSVGACQKVVTEAQYDRWIAYLRENPEDVALLTEKCAAKKLTPADQREHKVMAIAAGLKPGSLTQRSLCTNVIKAAVAGRLTFEDMQPMLKAN